MVSHPSWQNSPRAAKKVARFVTNYVFEKKKKKWLEWSEYLLNIARKWSLSWQHCLQWRRETRDVHAARKNGDDENPCYCLQHFIGCCLFTAPDPFIHLPFALSAHQCARGHRKLELLYSANRDLPVSRTTITALGCVRKPVCRETTCKVHT